MKKLFLLSVFLALPLLALAQDPAPNPATNQPNFSLAVSLLGGSLGSESNPGTDIGANFAANLVFPKIPTGWYLRSDNFIIPGASLQGFFGGVQGPLPVVHKYFNEKSFQPYIVGGIGAWLQTVGADTRRSIGYNAGGGLNYDPTGTGKFSINLIEVRATDKGPIYATTLKLGLF